MKPFFWLFGIIVALSLYCFLEVRRPSVDDGVEGVVTAKEWKPAGEDLVLVPDGNGGLLHIYVPRDEEWWIHCGDKKAKVTKEVFDKTEIQGWFSNRTSQR